MLERGARPGTAGIVQSMTCAASTNPVVYTGAEPVLIDSRRFLGRGEHNEQGAGDAEDHCRPTCIVLDPDLTGVSPSQLIAELASEDIESRHLWKPMHLQPVFASTRSLLNGQSELLFDAGVTLPSGSALADDENERVVKALQPARETGR
jgi:dTDP-4-amino-4,6-dideoxygalactose transaminase